MSSGPMKLGTRKRLTGRPSGDAQQIVEQVKAQAEEWVAQTHREFLEARARLDAELEAARSGQDELEAERGLRIEVERRAAATAKALTETQAELERERRQRAELERQLGEAEAIAARQRGQPQPEAEPPRRDGPEAGARRGRVEAWREVRALAAEGHSQREIARRLGLNRRTVARLIAAKEPPRYRRRPRGSMLDPLEPVMRSVLREQPGIDAPQMTEQLRRHGYRGSVDLVRRRLQVLREATDESGRRTG
jgi:hypothetical protein